MNDEVFEGIVVILPDPCIAVKMGYRKFIPGTANYRV